MHDSWILSVILLPITTRVILITSRKDCSHQKQRSRSGKKSIRSHWCEIVQPTGLLSTQLQELVEKPLLPGSQPWAPWDFGKARFEKKYLFTIQYILLPILNFYFLGFILNFCEFIVIILIACRSQHGSAHKLAEQGSLGKKSQLPWTLLQYQHISVDNYVVQR